MRVKYVLKGDDGSYYRGMTDLGPRFGASKTQALRFDTKLDLAREMGKHWACTGDIEEVEA